MSEKDEVKDQEVQEAENQEGQAPANENTEKESETGNDEIGQLKKDLTEIKDQNLRLYAEFENFRKRTAKERMELFSTANQELMGALLPILDDFHRAIKAQEDEKATEGMRLIYNKFENTLKNKGLKPMEDSTGKDFDSDHMEAITQIPAPEKKMKGKVVDEVEKGYYLGNKILRYAKVVVGE